MNDRLAHQDRKQAQAEFTKRLGQRVRELRKAKGLTQEKLGELAGYHDKYIGNIETAYYSPSAFVVARLADALDMTLSELVKGL